jgi:hypothetical protein
MAEATKDNRHGHPKDWLAGEPEKDKKQRNRLRILLTAIAVGIILFIICVLLAIGRANVRGYIPTLILELDLTPFGKPPLVLGQIKLPEVSAKEPMPESLDFPAQTIETDLEFDEPFTPVVTRRVEYVPVYEY